MSGVTKVVKYSLLTLNVLIFCSGLVMLIAGSIVQHKINRESLSRTIGGYSTQSGSIICIIFGIFIVLLAVLGIYSTLKDHFRFLIGYAVILSLIFVIQIVTGVTGLTVKNSSKFNDYVENVFANEFRLNVTKAKEVERDKFQTLFQCCGWQSVNDYRLTNGTIMAPKSCCARKPEVIQAKKSKKAAVKRQIQAATCDTSKPDDLYKKSCNMKITDATRHIIEVACAILVIFSVLNLSSISLSFLLSKQIRSGYQYT
jgi:hypothetical protein